MKAVNSDSATRLRFYKALRVACGIAAICLLFVAAGKAAVWCGVRLPAGVVGMGVLLLLLLTGLLPLQRIKPGADWLLAEMLLFFVPACVGVVRYLPLLSGYGGRILLAVVIGTACVLVSTALVVEGVFRLEQRLAAAGLSRRADGRFSADAEDMA